MKQIKVNIIKVILVIIAGVGQIAFGEMELSNICLWVFILITSSEDNP